MPCGNRRFLGPGEVKNQPLNYHHFPCQISNPQKTKLEIFSQFHAWGGTLREEKSVKIIATFKIWNLNTYGMIARVQVCVYPIIHISSHDHQLSKLAISYSHTCPPPPSLQHHRPLALRQTITNTLWKENWSLGMGYPQCVSDIKMQPHQIKSKLNTLSYRIAEKYTKTLRINIDFWHLMILIFSSFLSLM